MSATASAQARSGRTTGSARWRAPLLTLAAIRGVLAAVAIPLAPALYRDHIALLVLLRPTKEVLLLAGYVAREGRANLGVLVLASIPLMVVGVWIFYFLARAYRKDLEDHDLPGIAGRVLPRKRIGQLCDALGARGWPFVFVGRLAIMPSTLVAAAAGTANLPTRTFLAADAAGAAVSIAMTITAGYLLGEARDEAGPWLTAVGAVAVLGLLVLLGERLRRQR